MPLVRSSSIWKGPTKTHIEIHRPHEISKGKTNNKLKASKTLKLLNKSIWKSLIGYFRMAKVF
jgi:hypothetical protein